MTIPLGEVAREAPFMLYGIRATKWNGAAFVGAVARSNAGVRSVELDYLDSIDETTMGLGVVCIEGAAVAAREIDPIEAHCASFVPRFDSGYMVSRMRKRRASVFPAADFRQQAITVPVAGVVAGAELLHHKQLPLQLLRVAMRAGSSAVDVGIAGWRLDVKSYAPMLEPVDAAFANEFDLAGAAYDVEGEP